MDSPNPNPTPLDYASKSWASSIWIALLPGFIFGFFFGIVLVVLGFLAAGGGEGCYVLIGLFSSPAGLSENIYLTLIATPVIWAIFGALAMVANRAIGRIGLPALMAAHFLALTLIWTNSDRFGDWHYFHRVKTDMVLGFVFYGVGQVLLWITFFWRMRRRTI